MTNNSDDNIKPCAYCSPNAYKRVLMTSDTSALDYDYTVKFDPKDRMLKLIYTSESQYGDSDKSEVCDTLPILYCPFCKRRLWGTEMKKYITCETCGKKLRSTVWTSSAEFYCSQKCLLNAPYVEKTTVSELMDYYGDRFICKDDGELTFYEE